MAQFSVLSPSVGKPDSHTLFSVLLKQLGAQQQGISAIKTIYTGKNYNLKMYTQTIKGPKMAPYSSFITPTGSHIQIYSEVQLYNKLYLYTIGLHTDTHIMQKHIKGPYSEILQKHKNNTTQEEKPKKYLKKTKTRFSVQNRTTQHL